MESPSCFDTTFLWYIVFRSTVLSSANPFLFLFKYQARERVQDFEHFDRYSNKVIDLFRNCALAGESIDVQDVFGRFTLDAAGEFLFGTTEMNTLDLPLPKPGKAALGPKGSMAEGDYGGFVYAFEEIQAAITARSRRSWIWPLYELFGDRTKSHNEAIDDWVRNFVSQLVLLHLMKVAVSFVRSHHWCVAHWKKRKRGEVTR